MGNSGQAALPDQFHRLQRSASKPDPHGCVEATCKIRSESNLLLQHSDGGVPKHMCITPLPPLLASLLHKQESSRRANACIPDLVCQESEGAALRYQCLLSAGPPAPLPAAEPNQGMLAIDKALAAGTISREAFMALDLNEIHFQKSPGSHCGKGSPEDFERKRRCTSLALQEQSSAGKEKGELRPGHAHVRAALCSICSRDI